MNSKVFDIITANGVTYLRYKMPEDADFVNHAVSTRHGGVSTEGMLRSLNLGFSTCDKKENVIENYRRFCKATGFDTKNLVFASQTHSDNVRYVTESDREKGIFKDKDYSDVDALITDRKNVALVIHTADCVPISYIDTKNHAIGNAHCGWRGSYSMLSAKTLDAMKNKFSTNPKDVICTVGPAICGSCYEVSEDLYMNFKNKFPYEDAIYIIDGKYHIDLMLLNKHILESMGVDRIYTSDLCTCCSKENLYSHRGLGKGRGLLSSVIEIK